MFRPEYPRPSFVREQWQNLNGSWDFEILSQPKNMLDQPLAQKIDSPDRHETGGRCGCNIGICQKQPEEISGRRHIHSGHLQRHSGAALWRSTFGNGTLFELNLRWKINRGEGCSYHNPGPGPNRKHRSICFRYNW